MSELEDRFLAAWREHYPDPAHWPEREYKFAASIGRKWRFDFAFPDVKVAIEMEGGGGRHHTFSGFHADCDKANAAISLGWRVLRFTSKHLNKDNRDATVELVTEVLRLVRGTAA